MPTLVEKLLKQGLESLKKKKEEEEEPSYFSKFVQDVEQQQAQNIADLKGLIQAGDPGFIGPLPQEKLDPIESFQAGLPKIGQSQKDIEVGEKVQEDVFKPAEEKLKKGASAVQDTLKKSTQAVKGFTDIAIQQVKDDGLGKTYLKTGETLYKSTLNFFGLEVPKSILETFVALSENNPVDFVVDGFLNAIGLDKHVENTDKFEKDTNENIGGIVGGLEGLQSDLAATVDDPLQKQVFALGNGAMSVMASIGMYKAFKSVKIAAALMSAIDVSSDYQKFKSAGYSDLQSLMLTVAEGTAVYYLEKIPLDSLFKSSWQVGGVRRMFHQGMTEAVTENLQGLTQNGLAKWTYDAERGYFDGWWETTWVSSLVGGGSVAVTGSINQEITSDTREKQVSQMVKDGYSEQDAITIVNAQYEMAMEKQQMIINNVNAGSFKEAREPGLAGVPGGLPQTSLAVPSAEQFETFSQKATDVEFTGTDDMTLIQDRLTGDILGVQNKAGDKQLFPRPTPLEVKPDRGVEAAEVAQTKIIETTSNLEVQLEQARDRLSAFNKDEIQILNNINKKLQSKELREGDLETARRVLGKEIETAIEKVRESIDPSMSDELAFSRLKNEILPSQRKIKILENKIKAIKRDAVVKAKPSKRIKKPEAKEVVTTDREIVRTMVKAQEKASKAGFLEGVRSIKKRRTILTDELHRLLPKGFREGFAKRIDKATTDQAVGRVLNDMVEKSVKVQEELEANLKRNLKDEIKKELKKTKTGKDKKGVTTVEFEMLRGGYNQILNNTEPENVLLLKGIQEKMELNKESDPIDYRDRVTYALLTESTKGLGEMSVDELDTTLTRLQQTRKIARDSFLWKEIERSAEIAKKIDTAKKATEVKHDPKRIATNHRGILSKMGDAYTYLDIADRGFKQVLTLLDKSGHTRFFRDDLFQPVTEAHKTYLPAHFNYVEQDSAAFRDAFGFKSTDGVSSVIQGNWLDIKIKGLTKKKPLGLMTDSKGEQAKLTFTKAEMMDVYISSKMAANKRAITENGIYVGQKGQKKKVFYLSEQNIEQIIKEMGPEAKKVADYIIKSVKNKEFTKEVTDSYEEKFNKPFPFVDGGYWTLNRRFVDKKGVKFNIFKPEISQRTIQSPNSMKERVESDLPIEIKDAFVKYSKWREDMLRFIHYDKVFSDMLPIIRSPGFKSTFIEVYGPKAYNHFYNSFFYVAKGGNMYDDIFAKTGSYVRSILAIEHLGGRSRALVTQGGSALAASADIPLSSYSAEVAKVMARPDIAYKKMMESPLVRYRHKQANFNKGLFEKEIQSYRKQGLKPVEIFMSPIKGGDMLGVIGGGYPVYSYYKKQFLKTMSEAQAEKMAMQRAENFITDTQQSSLPEYANLIMQQHPMVKIAGAYQQPTSMYRAKGFEAIKEWQTSKRTRADTKKMIKEVTTYHVVLPTVFELSKGNVNPLSIGTNVLFSPLTGFMGYGKVASYAVHITFWAAILKALGVDDEEIKKIKPFNPLSGFGSDLIRTFDKTVKATEEYLTGEDDEDTLFDLLRGIGTIIKVPVKNLKEEQEKADDVVNGDAGLLRLLETSRQYERRQERELDESFDSALQDLTGDSGTTDVDSNEFDKAFEGVFDGEATEFEKAFEGVF